MLRWVIAGVLLLVLVAVIVGDEFGLFSDTQDPMVAATVAAAGGTVDPDATIPGEEEVEPPNDEHPPELLVADKACEGLHAKLVTAGGDAWADKVGEALYETKGLTAPEVAALCVELEALPSEQAVARAVELTGIAP